MMTMTWRAPACLLIAAALAGCEGGATSAATVEQVAVTPGTASLWAGDTLRLAAAATDGDGRHMEADFTWSSGDSTIARVNAEGRVTAVRAGTVTLTARAGGRAGTATLTVSGYEIVYDAVVGGVRDLWVLGMDGEAPRRLLPAGPVRQEPAPTRDGARIAFVQAVRTEADGDVYDQYDIFVVNRDGTGLRRLTDTPDHEDQPAWSPDGTRLAYRSRGAGIADIWVMNADGSGKTQITFDALPATSTQAGPAWSPDGSRIAYASDFGRGLNEMDIWTMRPDGSDARRITDTADRDSDPAWSPDGTRIAFRRLRPGTDADLMIVPAAGGDATGLSRARFQHAPAWSPDGRMLAFAESSAPSDVPQLFTVRADWSGVQARTAPPEWGGASNPAFLRRGPGAP